MTKMFFIGDNPQKDFQEMVYAAVEYLLDGQEERARDLYSNIIWHAGWRGYYVRPLDDLLKNPCSDLGWSLLGLGKPICKRDCKEYYEKNGCVFASPDEESGVLRRYPVCQESKIDENISVETTEIATSSEKPVPA